MNRRDALRKLGEFGALGFSGVPHVAAGAPKASEAGLSALAFSSSFSQFKEQLGPTCVRFDHPLPESLTGTLFRNGPALMQRGDERYQHWFDGDGMIQSFRIHGQQLTHHGKVIQTDKYQAEKRAGKFLWSSFGTAFAESIAPQKPDDVNVANISVLPMGDEILALWEAGSAWRLEADTLNTLGRKVFSPESDGMPFSAHPRIDPQGRIWNFGYMSGTNKLALYELEPTGYLKRTALIDSSKTNIVHDFAMTEHYLIFVLMPIDFTPPTGTGVPSFLSMLTWDETSSVDLVVIDKETLSVVNKFEMPPFFAFHFGNAWEDGSRITIETARGPEFHVLMEQIKQATLGLPTQADHSSIRAMDIVIDSHIGSVHTMELPFKGSDFPCFDQRFAGTRTDCLIMLERSEDMPSDTTGFNTVSAFDRSSSDLRSWSYGADTIAEEHIFVPKPNSKEGQGWLIGTAFNWMTQRTTLSVFDVDTLADGPIASATLPYALPLGLHGKFVAANN